VRATVESEAAPSLQEVFENLFREHSAFVYRTAYRMTGRPEDAEDVLQAVFAGLLKKTSLPEFRGEPKAYLYRAAVNLSLNLIRARRRSTASADEGQLEGASWRQARSDEALRDRVREALAELSPKAAETLILRYVHGYSNAEIARFLGTSRGTIAIGLFRSRARLRRIISKGLGETQ